MNGLMVRLMANAPRMLLCALLGTGLAACGAENDAPGLLQQVSVKLAVTPATITLGEAAILKWSAASDAAGCTATSAWTGARGITGEIVAAPTDPGTYTYRLECTDADGSGNADATLTVLSSPVVVAPADRCYGINYVSYYNSAEMGYTSVNSDALIQSLPSRVAGNCVVLVVQWYMEKGTSTEVKQLATDPPRDMLTGPSPTDAQVRHAIQQLRATGMRVIVKPHVDIRDGSFRGNVQFASQADFTKWFTSYQNLVRRYAAIAQQEGAYAFVVGTELNGLVDKTLSYRTEAWTALIADVRQVFSGKLIYAADWPAVDGPGFWDAVDYVGVDAYFPLTDATAVTPTAADLVTGWKTVREPRVGDNALHFLEAVALRYKKPILFTEAGYQSIDACAAVPSGVAVGTADDPPRNEDCQANAYQAVFDTFAGHNWFLGALFWNWEVYPGASDGAPVDDTDVANHYITRAFTSQNKKAEATLLLNMQNQRL